MKRILLALALLAAPLAAETKLLYDFEDGTDGFGPKCNTGSLGVTSGKQSLEIDASGSTGWDQNLAILSQNEDWTDAVELDCDVFMPAGTKAAADYVQFIPVFSGPADGWYQTGKIELHDGANPIAIKVNGAKILQPWKLQLVLNSGKAIPGKIYVDNFRMRKPGEAGSLTVKVVDPAGKPIVGAIVAAGKAALPTDESGKVLLELPGDAYGSEVLGDMVQPTTFTANVPSGSEGKQTVVVPRMAQQPARAVHAWVQDQKHLREFDAHTIYGHNMAMWSGKDPFENPIQLKKLQAIHAEMIRIPGGEYGNKWKWDTGGIYNLDATGSHDWDPDPTWDTWKKWLTAMGPKTEALVILNNFLCTPQNMVDWIKDARANGIKIRYVELGNEPDLDPTRYFAGVKGGSTHVDNYVNVSVPFCKAIRANFPDIKILGPVTAQLEDRECPDDVPWNCNKYDATGKIMDDPKHEHWIHKFLRLMAQQGDLIDGISVHSYPYYPKWLGQKEDVWDAKQAFSKVGDLTNYMPQYKAWMREYFPAKADKMDIALTEYNMQVDETWVTADVEDAVWHANFIGEFIKQGGTIASAWDINTLKPADGGGHGMLDPNNDPTRPYAERAKYWIYKMMANYFTGTLVQAQTSDPTLACYASTDRGRSSVLLINQDPNKPAKVTVQLSGAGGVNHLRYMTLSHKGYAWSKVLYRAVVDEDPTAGKNQTVLPAPGENQGWRVFTVDLDPMSVTLAVLEQ